jgi:mono/diheme cytochrome c family protein
LETAAARAFRRHAIPPAARDAKNPVEPSAAVLAEGRGHFADHCAICHANDGSGNTDLGRSLYPPAPDMREAPTQSLSDGELWFVIHYGIPLTGMPAWGGNDLDDRDSWELVHFIRHLPKLTDEEITDMEKLNPKSAKDEEEDEEARTFLNGAQSEPDRDEPPREPDRAREKRK